jgi:histone H3/H4
MSDKESKTNRFRMSTRFPIARIKKIMQTDEEVGKVTKESAILISRALEVFVHDILTKTMEILRQKDTKTISASHLKDCVISHEVFDFLVDIVNDAPKSRKRRKDLTSEVRSPKSSKNNKPKKRKTRDIVTKTPQNTDSDDSDSEVDYNDNERECENRGATNQPVALSSPSSMTLQAKTVSSSPQSQQQQQQTQKGLLEELNQRQPQQLQSLQSLLQQQSSLGLIEDFSRSSSKLSFPQTASSSNSSQRQQQSSSSSSSSSVSQISPSSVSSLLLRDMRIEMNPPPFVPPKILNETNIVNDNTTL